jgi:hypothetical protein
MLLRFLVARTLSKFITALVCASLFITTLTPFAVANGGRVSFLRSRAQGNSPSAIAVAPQGTLPNLDEAKIQQPPLARAPHSIASILRSRRNPLAPRRRRVGDPLPTPSALPTPSILPTTSPLPTPSVPPPPHIGAAINSNENLWTTPNNIGLLRYLLAWNAPTSVSANTNFQFSSPRISSSYEFDFLAVPMPQTGNSKIVFASNRDGNVQIYSMNTDGSGLARLTTNSSNDDHPRWSPNGTKILFQSDRNDPIAGNQNIYVMNADGSGQTRLTTDSADDCNAEWSGDGNKTVFQSLRNGSYYQVYTMNADAWFGSRSGWD